MRAVSIVIIMSFLLAFAKSLSTAASGGTTSPVPVAGVAAAVVAQPFSLVAHAASVAAESTDVFAGGMAASTKCKHCGDGVINDKWLKACEGSVVAEVLSSSCCVGECLKTSATFLSVKTSRELHCMENSWERRQSCRDFLDSHHIGDGSKESPHRYWYSLPTQQGPEPRCGIKHRLLVSKCEHHSTFLVSV